MDVGGCLHNKNNAGAVVEKLTQPLQKLENVLFRWSGDASGLTRQNFFFNRCFEQTFTQTQLKKIHQHLSTPQLSLQYNHNKQFLCFIIQVETWTTQTDNYVWLAVTSLNSWY